MDRITVQVAALAMTWLDVRSHARVAGACRGLRRVAQLDASKCPVLVLDGPHYAHFITRDTHTIDLCRESVLPPPWSLAMPSLSVLRATPYVPSKVEAWLTRFHIRLRTVHLTGFIYYDLLRALEELPHLQSLTLMRPLCQTALVEMRLAGFKHLRTLVVSSILSQEFLDADDLPSSLTSLTIDSFSFLYGVKSLPPALEHLSIRNCPRLSFGSLNRGDGIPWRYWPDALWDGVAANLTHFELDETLLNRVGDSISSDDLRTEQATLFVSAWRTHALARAHPSILLRIHMRRAGRAQQYIDQCFPLNQPCTHVCIGSDRNLEWIDMTITK
jgi:hypothetical protein